MQNYPQRHSNTFCQRAQGLRQETLLGCIPLTWTWRRNAFRQEQKRHLWRTKMYPEQEQRKVCADATDEVS